MYIIVCRQDCSMRSFKKTTRDVSIFYFSSVKYQFYIHFKNKYQLGGVRSLDPLLGLLHWTPLSDFRPPTDTFPFATIHPPKVTEPLTPLHQCLCRHLIYTSPAEGGGAGGISP